MTRPGNDPDDFESFRERRRPGKAEAHVEPTPRKPAEKPAEKGAFFGTSQRGPGPAGTTQRGPGHKSTNPSISALIEGLEADETRSGPRPDASPPAPPPPTTLMAPLPPAEPQDATRAMQHDAVIEGTSSDPAFERFRAQRKKPSTARHKAVEPTPGAGIPRKSDVIDDGCADPEFKKFRAQHKPASGSHRKTARHAVPQTPPALEPTPRSGVPREPHDLQAVLASDRGADPAFQRFRPVEEPPPPTPPPAATARPSGVPGPAGGVQKDDGPLFFGTSTHERTALRARVMDERSDEEPAPPPS